MALASIAIRVCTSAAIPTVDIEAALGTKAGGALSEFFKEALASGVEAIASVAGERLEGERPGIQKVKQFGASG